MDHHCPWLNTVIFFLLTYCRHAPNQYDFSHTRLYSFHGNIAILIAVRRLEQSCIFHQFSRLCRFRLCSVNNNIKCFSVSWHTLFMVIGSLSLSPILIDSIARMVLCTSHLAVCMAILNSNFMHFTCRYIYTSQFHLATVQFGVMSLSFCIFSLGLSVGVVIAVGMLLYFQVSRSRNNAIIRINVRDY